MTIGAAQCCDPNPRRGRGLADALRTFTQLCRSAGQSRSSSRRRRRGIAPARCPASGAGSGLGAAGSNRKWPKAAPRRCPRVVETRSVFQSMERDSENSVGVSPRASLWAACRARRARARRRAGGARVVRRGLEDLAARGARVGRRIWCRERTSGPPLSGRYAACARGGIQISRGRLNRRIWLRCADGEAPAPAVQDTGRGSS